MDRLLNDLPMYVVIPGVVIVAGILAYIVLRSLREGREVSLWPPKIGPRQPNVVKPESPLSIAHAAGTKVRSSSEDVMASATSETGQSERSESFGARSARFPANSIALLYVESGHAPGTIFAVTAGDRSLTVGGVPPADLVIQDDYMSRSHFRIHVRLSASPEATERAYDIELQDLGSRNGTWVNGKQVERTSLNHNSLIEAGGAKIRFLRLQA